MLGPTSSPALKTSLARLRDRVGNNWPPILLSQQWSYPRSTIRLSHAGQEAAETSGLSLQRDHPFCPGAALSVEGTAEALVSVVARPGPEMSLPTLLEHSQDITIRYYARLGLMP